MAASPAKYTGVKIVPQSDLHVETIKDTGKPEKIKKDSNFLNVAAWKVKTLLQCSKLENLKLKQNDLKSI